MTRSLANTRKLINCIVISHGTVALGTDRPQVVYAQGPALTLGNVMTNLKGKGGHHILTPRHKALVLEVLVSTPEQPDLLSQGSRNLRLHKR